MSDLCMYELEDNVWDEFGENDDHRVPHPSDEDGDKRAVQGDKQKKGRHGVIEMTDSANEATKYDIPGNEVNMTENDTLSESDLTINDSSMGGRCLKGDNIDLVGANDPILDESNNNSYDCSLSHVTQTDNGLNFYDNDGEDKQSSDLLYYGWPDIGNFEDVDRIFSCDSTFGMGNLNNGDELCWFSPSHAAEGPEEAVKSGFEFSCPESNLPSVLKNVSEQNAPSVDDSGKKSQSLSDKINSQTTNADDLAASGCIQFVTEIDAKSENGSQSVHKGQMNLQRKQSKHHGRDRKRKDCYSENSDCFSRSSNLEQFGNVKHPFEDSSKKFHGRQDIHTPSSENFKHTEDNRVSGQKPMHQSENETAGPSEVEGAGVPVNLDSSDLQESTCISSLSEKVSPQATSFRHLQQVTEQLDIRTKLCIRDSLYRLARSAEQRHGYLNPSDGLSNDRDVNGALVADETNKCAKFIDIETNTNPVDRSIAHLLFHRPRDPSVTPTNNASSLKAHAMAQGSLICSSTPEKQIFREIAACTGDKFPRDHEK